MAVSELPLVIEFLKGYQGTRVFFEPLWGNNGDTLICMGALRVFRQVGVTLVRNPNRANLIVLNGGSGLTHVWGGHYILEHYCSRFPEKPVVVLPSSWDFNPHELLTMVGVRSAPCFLYARERYSFERLKSVATPGRIEIGLDHDMAFHLKGSTYLASLLRARGERHNLVVERGDVEGTTGVREQPSKFVNLIRHVVPNKVRHALPQRTRIRLSEYVLFIERPLNVFLKNNSVYNTDFVREALKIVEKRHSQYNDLPIVAADISLKHVRSFRSFRRDIALAAVVITTRLHVGILASLLGKPTYIKSGNWKLKSRVVV